MTRSQPDLRILHIVLSIGETNAAYNEHCLPLAEKRDITICTYFRAHLTPPPTIALFEGDGSLAGFFRVLKAALDAKKYDVIHAHSPHVAFLFLAAAGFGRRNFPRSTVVTVHDSYQNYKLRNRLLFLPVFAGFQKVVCCSRASFDSFPAFYKFLAGDRLRFVQNGLDLARIDRIATDARHETRSAGNFTVVTVSRLVGIKNLFSVLAAFQQSADPTSRLVCIGDGPLRQSLITKIKEAGLENQVELTGLLPREKVFGYLLGANLFVSASRGEGLPVAVLEAMASSCPVLLSDIPPHREIAQGLDTIPLIQADDVSGFAREIRRFREMSDSERAAAGQNCRQLVERQFSVSAMLAQYTEIYGHLADKRGLHDQRSLYDS